MAEAAPTGLAGGGDSGESRVVGDYTRPTHVHRRCPMRVNRTVCGR